MLHLGVVSPDFAGHAPREPHLLGWYLGFLVAAAVLIVMVILVQAILSIARRIGMQVQTMITGLTKCWDNTVPLPDLQTTVDHADAIVEGLLSARKSLGG